MDQYGYISSTDKEFISGLCLAANGVLGATWTDGVTRNYAGTPNIENDEIVSVEPFFDGTNYMFPLGGHQDSFLEAGIITEAMLEEFGS